MKKQIHNALFIILCISCSFYHLTAQEKLKVDGDAQIKGILRLTEGNNNIIIGDDTGFPNTGNANTFLGAGAGINNKTGSSNTFLGRHAGFRNISHSGLVAVGDSALFNNGQDAISVNQSIGNTAVGTKALFSNTRGSSNTANGFESMFSNTWGAWNTATGYQAMFHSISGWMNIATGYQTLFHNTTGDQNTATGYQALYSNTLGFANTAFGYQALYSNIESASNTAIGYQALFSNSNGYQNIAVGSGALRSNTTGGMNTALGYNALFTNDIGIWNLALGFEALNSNNSGDFNTANGYYALSNNTTGSNNTAHGKGANVSTGDLGYATALGTGAISNATEKTVIGRNQANTVIGGYVNWSNLSDGRFKEAIKENVPGLEFIRLLRPVTYWINLEKLQRHITSQMPDTLAARYLPGQEAIAKATQDIHTGFVAQEVEAAAREIGYRFDGVNTPKNSTDNYSIAYGQFVPSLVKATQEQQAIIEKLEAENTEQDRKLGTLLGENRALRSELEEMKAMLERLLDEKDQSEIGQTIPIEGARLFQNTPNPFTESTYIEYFLPDDCENAQIQIADMTGRVLQLETIQQPGSGRLKLQAHSLPAGSYAYSLLMNGTVVETKQMIRTGK